MSSDDARTRILDAAGPVFAEKGYLGASVREICDAADVNQAAINYYFGGKEALYAETFRLAHPVSSESPEALLWPAGMSPEAKLRSFVERTMTLIFGVEKDSWQGRLLVREMIDPRPACLEQFGKIVSNRNRVLSDIFREMLPEDVPNHVVQKMAFTVVGQCIHYKMGNDCLRMVMPPEEWEEHFGTEQIVDHITNVCLAAVGRGPAIHEGAANPRDDHSAGTLRDAS